MMPARFTMICGAVLALAAGCASSESGDGRPPASARLAPPVVSELLAQARTDVGLDETAPEPRILLSPDRPLELTDHLELTERAAPGRGASEGAGTGPARILTPGDRLSLSWSVAPQGDRLVLLTVAELPPRGGAIGTGLEDAGAPRGLIWNVAPVDGDRVVLDVPPTDGIGLFAAAVLPERALDGSGSPVATAWAAVAPTTTVEEQFATR